MQVIDPTIKIKFKENSEDSSKGDITINKKTPAVTIVAAWINAETGVGPSIASGNQTCRPNCADLPMQPINKSKLINVNEWISNPKKLKIDSFCELINSFISLIFKVPNTTKVVNNANNKPATPTLLTIKAFKAALLAFSL